MELHGELKRQVDPAFQVDSEVVTFKRCNNMYDVKDVIIIGSF